MHREAYEWLEEQLGEIGPTQSVYNLGSRDAGFGRVSDLFPGVGSYIGIDLQPGPGVNLVGDIYDVDLFDPNTASLVVCAEVLEHTNKPLAVIMNAYYWLRPGGILLVTAAGKGRLPHTCLPLEYEPEGPPDQDGGYPPNPGEWYQNVTHAELNSWLVTAGFRKINIQQNADHHDIYAKAVKP